jgi:hypothetical protein
METMQNARRSGNWMGLVLGGLGVGAALMYLFDPDRGRGRRARISDQVASKVNKLARQVQAKSRHLRNRTQGFLHDTSISVSNQGETSRATSGMDQGPYGTRH